MLFSPTVSSVGALQLAIETMVLAERLGAPKEPLLIALSYLERVRTGIWPMPPKKVAIPKPQVEVKVEKSPWDPDSAVEQLEVGRCRALLLEVIRRAIHDWILYRGHSKLEMRQRAESAHTWLFEEAPGHPWYKLREREGETIMAFLTICESLDLEPSYVRQRAKQTTIKQIMTAGRPAEHRKDFKEIRYEEHAMDGSVVGSETIDALDGPRGSMNSYEAHFASYTPDYM